MKIAIINFSGNVGKTTIASHLLKPRMIDAQIFSVESINPGAEANGLEVEKIKGKRFGELLNSMMQTPSAIVDVGASNVEDFLKLMQQYTGSHEDFDFFVVPVTKERKAQGDSVNTIRALEALGVEKNKIRMVFNKVEVDDSVYDDFSPMFGFCKSENSFIANKYAVIYANEVFEKIKNIGKSLGDITTDNTDYREKFRQAIDENEKDIFLKMLALKRLSISANKNLDDVFNIVFG